MSAHDCPDCVVLARWVARVGIDWKCWSCGAELEAPPDRERKAHVDEPEVALELVAQFNELWDGASSAPPEPNLVSPGPIYMADPERVAEIVNVKASHHGKMKNDLPEIALDRSPDFIRAVHALRRLDGVLTMPCGTRAALTLAYCFWWLGQRAREVWWTATDESLTLDADEYAALMASEFGKPGRRPTLGLDWRVGMVFTDQAQRLAWLLDPTALGTGQARMHGRALLGEAVMAWRSAPPRGPHRVSLARARDVIGRLTYQTDEAIQEILRPRVLKRHQNARYANASAGRATAATDETVAGE